MARVQLVAALSIGLCAYAADWLGTSAVQPHETVLNASNSARIQVIWKYKLDAAPTASPVILGRWVTHRGTKELVFIGAGDQVYAIDGDLGKLFWQKQVAGKVECLSLAPDPNPTSGDDDDDDAPQPLRPLFVYLAGGKAIGLHPSDGAQIEGTPPRACRGAGFRSVQANGVTYTARQFRTEAAPATGLAIANGHVVFGTSDGSLYGFGFPVDQ